METEVNSHDALILPSEYSKLPRHPIYLILDNFRSAFNVGSVFRTAETARIEKIMLCGYTAFPPHEKLARTSMGVLPYVEWQHYAETDEAIQELRAKEITVVAMETTKKSIPIHDYVFPSPIGIVLGNEALGVSKTVLGQVDSVLEIPMFGFKNSMNVSVACGIVLFEIIRKWEGKIEPILITRK
jgi:tRNA G18 (ribose-2'-O)-methylase SpoU